MTACQSIGVHVVSTVCDQMSTNCAAISALREKSRRDAALKGEEFRGFGFRVNDEIIPIFDPPHLIKGLRNNLHLHDVCFSWQNAQHTASWSHISQLYELDVGDYDTKTLPHLTEAHVSNLKKMKVKLAAQVLSKRVSSQLQFASRLGKYIFILI